MPTVHIMKQITTQMNDEAEEIIPFKHSSTNDLDYIKFNFEKLFGEVLKTYDLADASNEGRCNLV